MISISIVICAYNEEKNISGIIFDIFEKKLPKGLLLEKVVIVSDGSTDGTNKKILDAVQKYPKITPIIQAQRAGKSASFNTGKNLVNSDFLISLDADIRIPDELFFFVLGVTLEKLDPSILLIGGEAFPEKPKKSNFITLACSGSYYINSYIKKSIHSGNSFYAAHGRILVLKKELYKNIELPNAPGTDQFMYLSTISQGGKFLYLNELRVSYTVPENSHDYFKQSSRYLSALKVMKSFFGQDLVERETTISMRVLFLSIVHFLLEHSIVFSCWSILYLFSRGKYIFSPIDKSLTVGVWNISESTK